MKQSQRIIRRENRFYAISYALSSMRAYPFRALSLAITLGLGVSLIASVLIWADTGVQVSVNNYFDEHAFQMSIQPPANLNYSLEKLTQAEQFAQESSFVDQTFRVNSTIGLVYGTNLPNDTEYGIDEPIYTYGMKDCEVFFVNNRFLQLVKRDFSFEGQFQLQQGEVLVSTQFVNYVHEVFGIILSLNSTLDVELLMNASSTDTAALSTLGRTSLSHLRIVGIYEVKGYNSLLERAFPSRMRSNYAYLHFDTPVLGIRDSIMVLSRSVDLSTVAMNGFFVPHVFVRASANGLLAAGADKIAGNLFTLRARLQERFDVEILGLDEILSLQGVVDTYLTNLPLISLNLPLFLLALFLSVFAADTFMAARALEVSALRSKGASSTQIYSIFISETIIIAFLSMVLGILLSIVFAALIPSTVGFLRFDWATYNFYLNRTVLTSQTVLYSLLICILPPILFIFNSAWHATRAEIGTLLSEKVEPITETKEAHGFTLGASLLLLLMVVSAALFLPAHPLLVSLEVGLGTAAWFFLAYNGSRVIRLAFAKLTARLSFLLGEKTMISAGNLKMRKGRIVPLMVVLALTLSLTVTFPVQAQSFETDLKREIQYAVGADLRVSTTSRPFNFSRTVEEYPGVTSVTPILQTSGEIGTERITIEAINPMEYGRIAHFDKTSFKGVSSDEILSKLKSVENGILLSEYHLNRWNKSVGDTIALKVSGKLFPVTLTFKIVGIVYSAPGFGYASVNDIPPSRFGAAFGYQARLSGFAIANLDYISSQTSITTARLFLGDLVSITNQDIIIRALNDLPGVSATTPERFDLAKQSYGTALFLSTIEGLSSIGFVTSFLLSVFALTLFLGSIVRERRRDYAILRAVGSSKSQIVRTVLSEFTGIILAAITLSLILGTIFGLVTSIIIFAMSPFSRILLPSIAFPIGFLTMTIIIEIVAMIAGSYLPANEAAKTDPAIVLRNL